MPRDWTSLDIAIATSRELPDSREDEARLADALAARGLRAGPVVWSAPEVDWRRFRLCIVRTTWDSHLRRDEFVAWADRAGALTPMWNPPSILRWNTHKGYLRDLEARGIPLVPTAWLDQGDKADLAALLEAKGWTDAVVKPAVSAGAQETIRVKADRDLSTGQAHLARLLARQDMMVQPYLASVEGYGERSLIFIEGELTHAGRKDAALAGRPPDLLNVLRVEPATDEVALARRILDAVGQPLLYARVDLARDASGAPCLMELEITEPNLFMKDAPHAVERLADVIAQRARADR